MLTGETGAGKTVLAHALDLLLGGKARPGIVRPGAAEAYVEGVFDAARRAARARWASASRRTPRSSCSRGASAPRGARAPTSAGARRRRPTCARRGAALLAFYGQHEHRRLTLASAQLEIARRLLRRRRRRARRAAFAAAHARVRDARGALEELRERAGARDRELDLLEFELEEIEAAEPSEAEEAELSAERERLRHVEALRAAALGGRRGARRREEGGGAAALLAAAARALDGVAGVDAELDGAGRALARAGDRGRGPRRASCAATARARGASPGGLDEVEERLARARPAQAQARRHDRGGARPRRALPRAARRARRAPRRRSEDGERRAGRGRARARARSRGELRAARGPPRAARWPTAVRERLAELAMEGATFEVALVEPRAPGPTGADAVEFLIAPEPGRAGRRRCARSPRAASSRA